MWAQLIKMRVKAGSDADLPPEFLDLTVVAEMVP